METNAKQLADVLDLMDSVGDLNIADKRVIRADKECDRVVCEVLARLPGVVEVNQAEASLGSRYYDVWTLDAQGEDVSLTVRVSNHARRPNSNMAPAWSFEVGDSITSIINGLETIAAAVAEQRA